MHLPGIARLPVAFEIRRACEEHRPPIASCGLACRADKHPDKILVHGTWSGPSRSISAWILSQVDRQHAGCPLFTYRVSRVAKVSARAWVWRSPGKGSPQRPSGQEYNSRRPRRFRLRFGFFPSDAGNQKPSFNTWSTLVGVGAGASGPKPWPEFERTVDPPR